MEDGDRPSGGGLQDSAGNIMQYLSSSYSYNAEGEMISGAGTTYTYDGSGERVMKPGKLYWKGIGSTALAETDATDHNPTQYIFFNGARIARIDAGATTPKYYIADHLGSTALVTDSLGNILNESLFFPYGVERVIQQNDSANNYKFTGKERDAETGLDDFGARYYVSTLGRFMSPDWDAKPVTVPYASFGDPQTLNLDSYVENAPLNKVDADGHGPPDSNPSFGGNSLEHYYFGLDGVNDAACAELNGCGEEEQAQRQTEESGDEAAYVERVQDGQQNLQTPDQQAQQQSGEGSDQNIDRRNQLAEAAYNEAKGQSTTWAQGNGAPKCNVFVCDMLNKVGIGGPTYPGGNNPIVTADWANPKFKIDKWRVLGSVESPQAGDVAAYKENFSNATGHSAIVTGNENGKIWVVAAGSKTIYQTTAGSQYFGQGMVITYRRYTGP